MGAVSVYIIASIVQELGGGIPALIIAAASYLLAPGFLIVNTLLTPNAAEELIWLLATWKIFQMIRSGNPRMWTSISIITGIGFLNKYSVVFLVAGFLVALIFSGNRKLFTSKYFFLSVILGLVIISPNIVWQYSHGWPVIIHMNELRSSQLDLTGYLSFPVSLFSFCQGSSIIWLSGMAVSAVFCNERHDRYLGNCIGDHITSFLVWKGERILCTRSYSFSAYGGYFFEKYLTGRLENCRLFSLFRFNSDVICCNAFGIACIIV